MGHGNDAQSPKDGFVGLELIKLDTLDPKTTTGLSSSTRAGRALDEAQPASVLA